MKAEITAVPPGPPATAVAGRLGGAALVWQDPTAPIGLWVEPVASAG